MVNIRMSKARKRIKGELSISIQRHLRNVYKLTTVIAIVFPIHANNNIVLFCLNLSCCCCCFYRHTHVQTIFSTNVYNQDTLMFQHSTFSLCEISVRSQFVLREHSCMEVTVAPLQQVAGTRSKLLLRLLHHTVSLNSYSLVVASTRSSPQQSNWKMSPFHY